MQSAEPGDARGARLSVPTSLRNGIDRGLPRRPHATDRQTSIGWSTLVAGWSTHAEQLYSRNIQIANKWCYLWGLSTKPGTMSSVVIIFKELHLRHSSAVYYPLWYLNAGLGPFILRRVWLMEGCIFLHFMFTLYVYRHCHASIRTATLRSLSWIRHF